MLPRPMFKGFQDWYGRIGLGLFMMLMLLPTASAQAEFFFGVFCFFWIALLIVNILICIWVYKDAEKRGQSGILWLLVVLVAGIIGIIIWLVIRPPERPIYPQPPPQVYYGPPPGYPPQQPPYYPPQG